MSTTIDTEDFRKRLVEERKRVKEAIDYLHEENPGSIQDEAQDSTADNHPADVATVTFDRELDYSLEENEERLLAAIRNVGCLHGKGGDDHDRRDQEVLAKTTHRGAKRAGFLSADDFHLSLSC